MAKKAYIGVDGKARKVKKGYIGVENFVPRALPEGYTQLSHIEATGAQYFDTGFSPNQDTRVVCKAQYTDVGVNGALFGSRYGTNQQRYDFLVATPNFFSAYNTSGGTSKTASTDWLVIDKNKNTTTINGVVLSEHTYANFQTPCNMVLFAENTNGTVSLQAKAKVWDYLVYDNGALIRDYVPCKNPSGVVGLYDMVNGTFGGSATSTPFVAGSSVQSVARKIKKAYIGIGGVARPCWSGGELAYYGTITGLSVGRSHLAATSVGEFALFGGGSDGQKSNVVDAYNTSLTRKTATALSKAVSNLAAETAGSYALFAGGMIAGSGKTNVVNAYDTALTRSLKYLGTARHSLAATTVGNCAVFAGGFATNATTSSEAFDESLTKTTIAALSVARYMLAATSVGNYALFGGGGTGNIACSGIDAYNDSLTRTTAPDLSETKQLLVATSVGNLALFAGGTDYGERPKSTVDAYDNSLTKTSAPALSAGRGYLTATNVGNYALFGGGWTDSGDTNVVDVYDASLTRTVFKSLSVARSDLAATAIGDYALFAGGYVEDPADGEYESKKVDVFVVA